jgi:hypothetical protein
MAKSIRMMAFFLTMPINGMTPMIPITPRSWPASIKASSAPMPAEGRGLGRRSRSPRRRRGHAAQGV